MDRAYSDEGIEFPAQGEEEEWLGEVAPFLRSLNFEWADGWSHVLRGVLFVVDCSDTLIATPGAIPPPPSTESTPPHVFISKE